MASQLDCSGMIEPLPAGYGWSVRNVNTAILSAFRGEAHSHVPVWFLGQTGQSFHEYRAEREAGSILDAIRQPELAAQMTLLPVQKYGVDAAVLFSDIIVPVAAIGFGVDVVEGIGLVVEQPLRTADDLRRLRPLEPDTDTPYVAEAIRHLVTELDVPLIGVAGGAFTIASYLIEGRQSRTHTTTKALMYTEPELWHRVMDLLTNMAITSLRSQVLAGATAVQLCDPEIGTLSPSDYERFVLPHSTRLFKAMADMMAPRIYFGAGTGELLEMMGKAWPDTVGVDLRVPIDVARERVGPFQSLQGNLDPALCLAPWEVLAEVAREILHRNAGNPGFIFNLGGEVLPQTDPTILRRLVDLVHEEGVVAELDEYDRTGVRPNQPAV